MKEKKRTHWAMTEIAEQEAPGNTIELWPRIQARITPKASHRLSSPISGYRRKAIAFGMALLLLLAGLITYVPEVRAFAEDIIQRMGIAFVDTKQYEDTTVQMAVEAIRVTPPPSLSVEEIREQIDFPLLLPTWLPDGLIYVHRSIGKYDPQSGEGSGKKVSIEYGRTADFDPASGLLFLHANNGAIGAPPLLAESRQQMVTVNGLPAIYVHGGWQSDGRGDPNTRMGSLQWDDQADDAYLTWIEEGVTYLLEAHNLGMDLDDLLRIVESMKYK